MNHYTHPTHSQEQGSVLVIALILLVLLTLIGISASKNTETEIMIAGNERVFKQNFYLAEGAAMRAVQIMEGEDIDSLDWVLSDTESNDIDDPLTDVRWKQETSPQSFTLSDLPDGPQIVGLSRGVMATSSWKMTSPKVYEFEVYGLSRSKGGEGFIQLGYRKAY